jgi:hypothetical protein
MTQAARLVLAPTVLSRARRGQKQSVEGGVHFALKQTSFSLYPNRGAALAN